MKSIALLTMIFFPATFLSVCIASLIAFGAALTQLQALFSTTFFSFGDNGWWQASPRQWIYWAITIPVTLLVVAAYNTWLFYNRIQKYLKKGKLKDANHLV